MPRARSRRSAGVLIAAAFSLALLALVAGAAYAPAPRPLLRALARASARRMLSDVDGLGNGRRQRAAGLLRRYLDYQLARAFWQAHRPPAGASDPERVLRLLTPLRDELLTQDEVPHAPSSWSIPLSGLGFCDQVNAFAAEVLAREFGLAELVAVTDPVTGGGHTVGRVRSGDGRGWLYFDVWPAQPVALQVLPGGGLRVFHQPAGSPPDSGATLPPTFRRLYLQLPHGRTFAGFPARFGSYVLLRLTRPYPSAAPPATEAATLGAAASPAGAPSRTPPAPDAASTRDYVSARVDDLFGDTASARREYRAIARRPGAQGTLIGATSAIFGARP